MRRKIWIICSVFAVLLWLVSLAKMLFYTQGFGAATEAAKPLDLGFRLSEAGFDVLFMLFLLFLSWFLAYGFARLLSAVLTVLLISALIEFAAEPCPLDLWRVESFQRVSLVRSCQVCFLGGTKARGSPSKEKCGNHRLFGCRRPAGS